MTATAEAAPTVRTGDGATARPPARRYRLLPGPVLVIVTVVLCAMVLIPIAYIVLASLNTDLGVAEGQIWPSTFSLESYSKIWTTANLATGLVNSLIVVCVHRGGVGAARHHHRVRAGALRVHRPRSPSCAAWSRCRASRAR